jgi:hypothetical protein
MRSETVGIGFVCPSAGEGSRVDHCTRPGIVFGEKLLGY